MEVEMQNRQRNRAPSLMIAEMVEFATFEAGTQRYIRRSMDVDRNGNKAVGLWSRDQAEKTAIEKQLGVYAQLPDLREIVPIGSVELEMAFMASLISISAFDLGQARLPTFSSYRFLYERLLGARVRPWLPSAFCAASALPQLKPDRRKKLLHSISEAAATAPGWSEREPLFFPEWVDKVEAVT